MNTGAFQYLIGYTKGVVVVFLGALFLLVAYRLLTGAINTRGLLQDKSSGGDISPARVQLLLFSLGGAFFYLMGVVELVQSPASGALSLPEPSQKMLELVLGSNAIYLTAKTAAAARQNGFRSLFR